jgi:acetylornithine deacetylase/succinyl-diaminopimelate desuccinylase-like protein
MSRRKQKTDQEKQELLRDAIHKLSRHFDAIEITASKQVYAPYKTISFLAGTGNEHTRQGMREYFKDEFRDTDFRGDTFGDLRR